MEMKIEEIKAIPSLVLRGRKQSVTALAILMRHTDEKQKKELLKIIAEKIYLHRAVLSEGKPGVIVALFNVPVKQFRHELEAIKTAVEIMSEAKRKFINVGIGINSGKAVVSDEKDKIVNYTCMGDVVTLARKLSAKAKSKILISEFVQRITDQNIRGDKEEDVSDEVGQSIYSINKVNEREKYKDYVNSVLRRWEEESKKKPSI